MKIAKVLWGATDFGAPHFSSDLLWKTGFRAPDPFFLVEIKGKTFLFVSPLEIGRVRKEARADKILLFESFLKRGETPAPTSMPLVWGQAHGLIRFLKAQKIREVVVPHAFPHGIARAIGETFTVHDSGHSLYPERARKSKKEIEEITAAQRACEDAAAAAAAFLRGCKIKGTRVYDDGRVVTSEMIRRIIDGVLRERGYLAFGTIVACGPDVADPHRMGHGEITARMPMVMDIFPVSLETHYWADMTRTFFKGEPSRDFIRMYEVVREAQEMAIAMIRPGADGSVIHHAVADYFSSQGYPTRIADSRAEGFTPTPARGQVWGFIHGLGHGVGIDIHEPPHLGARSQILESGNVITIEPGLYYRRPRRAPRGRIPAGGIRIEDIAVVTKKGCDLITRFPKALKSAVL